MSQQALTSLLRHVSFWLSVVKLPMFDPRLRKTEASYLFSPSLSLPLFLPLSPSISLPVFSILPFSSRLLFYEVMSVQFVLYKLSMQSLLCSSLTLAQVILTLHAPQAVKGLVTVKQTPVMLR